MSDVYWGWVGANQHNAAPTLMMLGDSWLWYPISNLAREIHTLIDQDILVVGRNGAEAQDWTRNYRKDIEQSFRLYAPSVQGLLLSGGGNDIAGGADFLRILKTDCSKATTATECYRDGQPDVVINAIIGAYRQVILNFRALNGTATVFTHNYDDPWPTGKGVFGPSDWLKAPMDTAKVPKDVAFRRELLRDLLDRLNAAQVALSREKGIGPMKPIKTTGTLPVDASQRDTWWANELHPTPEGFELLAKKIVKSMNRSIN